MKNPYGCTFIAFMFSCLHCAAASLMTLCLKVCLKAEIGSGKTADSVNTLLKLFGSGSMKFTEARLRTRPPLPPFYSNTENNCKTAIFNSKGTGKYGVGMLGSLLRGNIIGWILLQDMKCHQSDLTFSSHACQQICTLRMIIAINPFA